MAGAGGRVELVGAARFEATMGRLAADVRDFQTSHQRAGTMVAARAAQRAPKRTGRLAGSADVDPSDTNAVISFGGNGVNYANPIHWGVGPRPGRRGPHNIAPTRFATSALTDTEPRILPTYLNELDRKLGRVKGA